MITREQFINGILSYADNEIIPILPTIGKWGIGTIIVLARSKADNLITELLNNNIVKSLGVVSTDGLIDCDILFNALKASAERYGCLQINVPIIGIMKFSSIDVDKMKTYVTNEGARHDGSIMY